MTKEQIADNNFIIKWHKILLTTKTTSLNLKNFRWEAIKNNVITNAEATCLLEWKKKKLFAINKLQCISILLKNFQTSQRRNGYSIFFNSLIGNMENYMCENLWYQLDNTTIAMMQFIVIREQTLTSAYKLCTRRHFNYFSWPTL